MPNQQITVGPDNVVRVSEVGPVGPPGKDGTDGVDGLNGVDGTSGSIIETVQVDTLAPGSEATVEMTGNPQALDLALGIPRGDVGAPMHFVDAVPTFLDLPAVPEDGALYITTNTHQQWGWIGGEWVEISVVTQGLPPIITQGVTGNGTGLVLNLATTTLGRLLLAYAMKPTGGWGATPAGWTVLTTVTSDLLRELRVWTKIADGTAASFAVPGPGSTHTAALAEITNLDLDRIIGFASGTVLSTAGATTLLLPATAVENNGMLLEIWGSNANAPGFSAVAVGETQVTSLTANRLSTRYLMPSADGTIAATVSWTLNTNSVCGLALSLRGVPDINNQGGTV